MNYFWPVDYYLFIYLFFKNKLLFRIFAIFQQLNYMKELLTLW